MMGFANDNDPDVLTLIFQFKAWMDLKHLKETYL